MTIYGVDVSSYQGTPDWTAVFNSGRRFAFCKATQGTHYVDKPLAHNRQGTRDAGFLLVGLYHFASASGDPIAEADHFLAAVGGWGPREVPVLDSEGPAVSAGWATAWAQRVRAVTGDRAVVLYCNTSDFASTYRNQLPSGFDHWWAAQYSARPPAQPYRFWQYTDHATVPGVSGACDDSRFEGTEAQLAALVGAPQGDDDLPYTEAQLRDIIRSEVEAVVPTLVDAQLNEHGLAKGEGHAFPGKWADDLVERISQPPVQ